jgi:hypothetical protein
MRLLMASRNELPARVKPISIVVSRIASAAPTRCSDLT